MASGVRQAVAGRFRTVDGTSDDRLKWLPVVWSADRAIWRHIACRRDAKGFCGGCFHEGVSYDRRT